MISLQRRCKKRHLNQVFSIRGGLLLKKLTQKSYFTGLRGRFLCSFEFYRTAIIQYIFERSTSSSKRFFRYSTVAALLVGYVRRSYSRSRSQRFKLVTIQIELLKTSGFLSENPFFCSIDKFFAPLDYMLPQLWQVSSSCHQFSQQ